MITAQTWKKLHYLFSEYILPFFSLTRWDFSEFISEFTVVSMAVLSRLYLANETESEDAHEFQGDQSYFILNDTDKIRPNHSNCANKTN